MDEFNVTLAERAGLGRINLCGCKSIHLIVGPVTICLAPEAFVQAATMMREAMEQLAEMTASGEFEDVSPVPLPSQMMH